MSTRTLPAAAPAARSPRRPRVAVIDDSVSVCKAVERMIAPRGAEVVALHSGEEALHRLEDVAPDLVICDMVLPDLEGSIVCRFVRESSVLRKVPVIAITGLASSEARRSALAAGADAVLKKPFRGEALLADVDLLLAGTHGPPPPETRPPETLPPGAPPPEAPPPIRWVLRQIEALEGLTAGGWWLATGAQGRLRGRTGDRPADPGAMVARLHGFASALGMARPSIATIEGAGSDLLLIAHRDRRGTIFLRLGPDAMLGRARFLARKFLHHVDRLELPPSSSTEDGTDSWTEPGPALNPKS